jgi:predicted dehydrogenase
MAEQVQTPLRVGLIGCGGIANTHLAGYRLVEEAELVACCDVVAGKADEFAAKAGIEDAYTDYEALLARDDLDMVDLCAIDEVHAEMAVAAMEAGKHALIEKPFAMSVAEAEAIIAKARETGRKAMCAQSLRWQPKWLAIKRLLDEGRIGRPVYMRYAGPSTPFWTPDQIGAYRDRPAGWLLIHNGMHAFDLITWLLDSTPVRVHARSHPGQDWLPVHEYVTCVTRMESGAIAHTEQNRIMQPPRYPLGNEIHIVGTEGTIDKTDRLTHSGDIFNDDGYRLLAPGSTYRLSDPEMPFACEIREFARAVIEDTEVPIPLETSLAVLKAVLAGAESMQTGEAVTIDA